MLKLHPDSMAAHFLLGDAYYQKGMSDAAVDSYLQAARLSGAPEAEIESLRWAYRSGGVRGYYKRRVQLDLSPSKGFYARPYDIARDYAVLNDHDSAIAWLQKSLESHDGVTADVNLEPVFDLLRSDPRFGDLLTKMKLPQ